MKVPPKRKGNGERCRCGLIPGRCLNESPSEKEGKFPALSRISGVRSSLNESPSEKEGKFAMEEAENAAMPSTPQ